MIGRIKLAFIILLLGALSTAMYSSLNIKERSISELHEDVTFMRITMEARSYISQIEYGIKNGRQLDNFYSMQDTLKSIQGCSSYMEGAYIASASGKLLYQSGLSPDGLNLTIPEGQVYSKVKLYTMEEDGGYFYLTAPIRNAKSEIDGYLIMCVAKNAVSNAVLDYNRQNQVQTLMIGLEVLGIALFIIKRIRPNRKKRVAFRLALVLAIAITAFAVLDSGIVLARFYQIVSDTTMQSANKMAQALQSDVDSVVAKGVSLERIYDLNGWLTKNCSELTIVKSLTLDRNHKVTAAVSKAYIYGFFNRFLLRTAMLVLICLLCGLVACGITAMLGRMDSNIRKTDTLKGFVDA